MTIITPNLVTVNLIDLDYKKFALENVLQRLVDDHALTLDHIRSQER